MANPVHFEGASPARISTNLTVGNQTQNRSFGEPHEQLAERHESSDIDAVLLKAP